MLKLGYLAQKYLAGQALLNTAQPATTKYAPTEPQMLGLTMGMFSGVDVRPLRQCIGKSIDGIKGYKEHR